MNPAREWFDGKISGAKCAQKLGIDRATFELVAGAMWQEIDERVRFLDNWFALRTDIADGFLKEALKEQNQINAAGESAKRHAYADSRKMLRLVLGLCLERTSAGGAE